MASQIDICFSGYQIGPNAFEIVLAVASAKRFGSCFCIMMQYMTVLSHFTQCIMYVTKNMFVVFFFQPENLVYFEVSKL